MPTRLGSTTVKRKDANIFSEIVIKVYETTPFSGDLGMNGEDYISGHLKSRNWRIRCKV